LQSFTEKNQTKRETGETLFYQTRRKRMGVVATKAHSQILLLLPAALRHLSCAPGSYLVDLKKKAFNPVVVAAAAAATAKTTTS
jgi:hypothetical protein